MLHSVVEENGNFMDITPTSTGLQRFDFKPDPALQVDFKTTLKGRLRANVTRGGEAVPACIRLPEGVLDRPN
ncbi:hypothetical protein JNW90_16110 [Micromonospora sp. STR1s_5]|nr:hypothetical protein [Micromonospora sp. STR1s_5]